MEQKEVLIITGASGTGKSRLAYFLRSINMESSLYLDGRCIKHKFFLHQYDENKHNLIVIDEVEKGIDYLHEIVNSNFITIEKRGLKPKQVKRPKMIIVIESESDFSIFEKYKREHIQILKLTS